MSDNKNHWCIPADAVSIRPTKELYPAHLILSHHDYIEEIEIPNENYINIKLYGRWARLYLPSEEAFERSDSLKSSV